MWTNAIIVANVAVWQTNKKYRFPNICKFFSVPIPSHKTYPAKLLLFGEYTVTLGSGALAVPFAGRSGHWKMAGQTEADPGLAKLLTHLKNTPDLASLFDLSRFEKDLMAGLVFDSDIPRGYGLGSSGALVAAVYDSYVDDRSDNPKVLKSVLADMEGAFHGASSGIDPLVSYLGKPVLISDDNEVRTTEMGLPQGLFLLDTGKSRDTGPLVALFRQKMASDAGFVQKIQELRHANADAIKAAVTGEGIWQTFGLISRMQAETMYEMVPSEFRHLWQHGLETGDYYLKLCGAGGGGYILGMSVTGTLLPTSTYDVLPVS